MSLKSTYRLGAMAIAVAMMTVSCSKDEGAVNEEPVNQQAKQSFSDPIPGQYIVVFRETGKLQGDYATNRKAVANKTRRILEESKISDAEVLTSYSAALNGAAVRLSDSEVEKLRANPEVAYVEQDRMFTLAPPCGTPTNPCTDPGDGDSGGDGTSNEETPYGITRVNGVIEYTGSNVAWVIDTGIDLDHPDLNVDATRGYNAFTSGRDGKSLDDGNGHGSHVAGTIAAINNDIGVIGVAPGATVIPVKVLDSRGSGSYSGVIAGVDHVAAHGSAGDVANMSLGGGVSESVDTAVVNASAGGIQFVLAAGNDGADANNSSPARANGTYIFTISAMDINDDFASFSNYGNPPVDYAAPGVSVKSTWMDGGYNTISGTSMAAPHAAGVLLVGNASTDGTVNGDPDGNPDPIIVVGQQ